MIEYDLIFSLGLLLLVGGALGWLAARLRLPRITGYICAGVLLSPSVLPLLDRNQVNELTTLGLVLLGVIGFAIGCSIRLKDLTGLGRAIAGITIIQGFLAWGLRLPSYCRLVQRFTLVWMGLRRQIMSYLWRFCWGRLPGQRHQRSPLP